MCVSWSPHYTPHHLALLCMITSTILALHQPFAAHHELNAHHSGPLASKGPCPGTQGRISSRKVPPLLHCHRSPNENALACICHAPSQPRWPCCTLFVRAGMTLGLKPAKPAAVRCPEHCTGSLAPTLSNPDCLLHALSNSWYPRDPVAYNEQLPVPCCWCYTSPPHCNAA